MGDSAYSDAVTGRERSSSNREGSVARRFSPSREGSAARRFPKDLSKTAGAGGRDGQRKVREKHGKKSTKQTRRTPIRSEVLTGGPVDDSGLEWQPAASINPKWYEICRKVSYAITTQDALYELPPGWDDTETSPTWPNGLPDPSEPWFKITRPHEIWYMDDKFNRHIETFYIATGLADPPFTAGDSINMFVIPTEVNPNVNSDSRIYSALLTSTDAAAAIAQAQSEV